LSSDRRLVIASEAGVVDWPAKDIVAKGRLGPGEMLAVDLHRGELLDTHRIDQINASRAPFKRWLKQGVKYLQTDLIDPRLAAEPMPHEELLTHQKLTHQKMFNLTAEERDTVLKVLAETEAEAIGSMGDDTPLPLLSSRVRSLYDAFRQAFAQVTNPPIDSYRERLVMSLHTQIARESNLFELNPAYARQVMVNSPVLSQRKFLQILGMREEGVDSVIIDLNYPESEGLEAALERVCREAEEGVLDGRLLVVLSDRHVRPGHLPIHALMAVGAVHQHLVAKGLRTDCNMLVETATARDPHHFACLIGYGATAIYPYLAYQTIFDLARGMDPEARSAEHRELGRAYRRGIRVGLLKILSKMGISTIASYRGAALFEIVGLDEAIVKRCFSGTPSRGHAQSGRWSVLRRAGSRSEATRGACLQSGARSRSRWPVQVHPRWRVPQLQPRRGQRAADRRADRIARGLDGLRQAGQRARAGHAARSAGSALGHLHADPTGRSRIRQQHGQGLRLGRHATRQA